MGAVCQAELSRDSGVAGEHGLGPFPRTLSVVPGLGGGPGTSKQKGPNPPRQGSSACRCNCCLAWGNRGFPAALLQEPGFPGTRHSSRGSPAQSGPVPDSLVSLQGQEGMLCPCRDCDGLRPAECRGAESPLPHWRGSSSLGPARVMSKSSRSLSRIPVQCHIGGPEPQVVGFGSAGPGPEHDQV